MSNSKDSSSSSESSSDEIEASNNEGRELEFFGWVYHLGVNSIGQEYCHLRFLYLKGKYVAMYKRDPHENPGIKPIRKGVISHTLMVEELGRKKINFGEVYVLRFYNRLDEAKKGEIACATAGEARKWMKAFDKAKQQAMHDISISKGLHKLSIDGELNLDGHRPRVRRYAKGLKRLIRIGKGPEMLVNSTSNLGSSLKTNIYTQLDGDDAVEAHDWRCVRFINGVRIFEDVATPKGSKEFLLKAVGVVDASYDTVFGVILSLDARRRHEWDVLIGELELLDSVDGHYDVVYGTYEPKNLSWWQSKKDFIYSRQWFLGQDGAYTILQFPAVHKKRPVRSGYQRIKINPSVWEIRKVKTSDSSPPRCLVTLMLEVHSSTWNRFTSDICSKFEKTIPYALLCQVSGLKEYFGVHPSLTSDSPSTNLNTSSSDASIDSLEFEDGDVKEDFYDALAKVDSFDDEDSDDEDLNNLEKVKLKNVSWAIAGLTPKRTTVAERLENSGFNTCVSPVTIDLSQFNGSLHRGKGESDTNCWTIPTGQEFMIRGKNYLKDNSKIAGGDPLLKLLAVDFFKADKNIENIALHPNSLVQSEAGKRLPLIIILNLQIPAKPNYSMVLYFGAERPIVKESLLGRFVDGNDMFRDSRFKLIPNIVEGYWMVKRAVGSRACLLGKAVTCRYLRQDNFLEIDVDVGSSSVAKSIVGLVLGYVTSLVVDLAILIEGKEENELPESILGSVRLNRVRLDSAVPL